MELERERDDRRGAHPGERREGEQRDGAAVDVSSVGGSSSSSMAARTCRRESRWWR